MKIYDVTVAIREGMPIYEGDPKPEVKVEKAMSEGDAANVSSLCFGAHSGTHVDAPNHFIEGTRRVEDLELSRMVGPCRVFEVENSVMAIGPEHLPDLDGIERLLFKTRNSAFWSTPEEGFRKDFTYITPEAAKILADAGLRLVGIDYLSVEKFGSEVFATHKTLLEKEIVILEGLDLREVSAGDYDVICLPMKWIGGTGDGAPARTVLMHL